jgi:hypothetical protein
VFNLVPRLLNLVGLGSIQNFHMAHIKVCWYASCIARPFRLKPTVVSTFDILHQFMKWKPFCRILYKVTSACHFVSCRGAKDLLCHYVAVVAVEVGARNDVVDRKYPMAGRPRICLLARLVDQQAADRAAWATRHKTQAQAQEQERLPTWGEKKTIAMKVKYCGTHDHFSNICFPYKHPVLAH